MGGCWGGGGGGGGGGCKERGGGLHSVTLNEVNGAPVSSYLSPHTAVGDVVLQVQFHPHTLRTFRL